MKSRVSAEKFVRAWQSAKTIGEFSRVTGLRAASASTRARLYRRKGIKLKFFNHSHRGAPPLDVAVLNKIAGEYHEGKRAPVAAKRATKKRSVKRSKKK